MKVIPSRLRKLMPWVIRRGDDGRPVRGAPRKAVILTKAEIQARWRAKKKEKLAAEEKCN